MADVLIINGARTPMGALLGDLADASATALGTSAIAATLANTQAPAAAIEAGTAFG